MGLGEIIRLIILVMFRPCTFSRQEVSYLNSVLGQLKIIHVKKHESEKFKGDLPNNNISLVQ